MPVVVDRPPGEIPDAHIFVAVMAASSLSFAFATWSETLQDWSDGHVQAFAFFGGAARLLMLDSAKVAVIKACVYDPQNNRSYVELAAHYDTAVLPARPYRPRGKAKVEACVGIIERWLLGRLPNRVWYGLGDLNAAIAGLLARLNDERVLRRFGLTRRQLFEKIDAPHLKPLPATAYVLAQWRRARLALDYHVEVKKHFYSVPYRHARAAAGERIAAPMRGSGNGRHTTINDHMPSSHRRYGDWTIERIVAEAAGLAGTRSDRRQPEEVQNFSHEGS